MRLFQRNVAVRLPQDVDVTPGDTLGVPIARKLTHSAAGYAAMHERALRDGDHSRRATSCWGLIARGPDALPWVDAALMHTPLDDPDHEDLLADALGVLFRVGVPATWAKRLRRLARSQAIAGTEAGDILSDYIERLDRPPLPEPDAAGDYRTAAERAYDDRLLLKGVWAPLTREILFFRASVADCVGALIEGVRGRHVLERTGFPLASRPVSGEGLDDMLNHLLPLDSGMQTKDLFLPTANPEWTATFNSTFGVMGGATSSMMAWFAGPQIEAVLVSESPQRRSVPGRIGSWGERSLTHADYDHDGRQEVRAVQVVNGESGWYFREDQLRVGAVSNPSARKIADRFTRDHLVEIAARFGLRPFDDDFYAPTGHGMLVSFTDPPAPDKRTYSLAQMRGEQPR